MTQKTLFDAAEGKARREEAIERVEKHARRPFKEAFFAAVVACAARHDTLTTDDVWRYMPDDVDTHEHRAIGAIMRSAATAGHIEPTDGYRLSKMPACHRRPKRVWRSLVRA